MPMTVRPAMTQPTLGASAHATEPRQKIAMPATMTHLRPNRSARAPAVSIRLANTSEYALTTHCSGMTPAPRSYWMLPSATLTMVVSRKVRNRMARTVARVVARPVAIPATAAGKRAAGEADDIGSLAGSLTGSVWQRGHRRVVARGGRILLKFEQRTERLSGNLPAVAGAHRIAGDLAQQGATAGGDREGHGRHVRPGQTHRVDRGTRRVRVLRLRLLLQRLREPFS